MKNDLRESQSTVNQLTVQIQGLQEHINSLSDARDFKDLETASSSVSFHAPSQPMVLPSFLDKLRRDSSPQFDTRKLCILPGDVFVDPTISDEPTAILSTDVRAESPKATTGYPVNRSTERLVALMNQNGNLSDHCRRWSFRRTRKRFIHTIFMVEHPKNNISELQF